MSTHLPWLIFQNSSNFFQPQEESSQSFHRNNENSISLFGRLSSVPRQQESKSLLNIQAIIDNLVGRNEIFINKQDILAIQLLNGFNNPSNPRDFQPESQSQIQDFSREMVETENKKGLKNLAKLLIRTLKKKDFNSSKSLTEQIEQKLMKGKKISKNEHARQSKNIRRRTYDALNVMMAANVLGPDLAFIRRVNSGSFTKKCALIIGQKNQTETKIFQLEERINHKKEFLQELKKKRSALKWWINYKKMEECKKMNLLPFQSQKGINNHKNCKAQIKESKILLPVVIVQGDSHFGQKNVEINREELVKLKCKHQKIKLFSDIDCFQILKEQQQANEEAKLMTTMDKNIESSVVKEQKLEQKLEEQFFYGKILF